MKDFDLVVTVQLPRDSQCFRLANFGRKMDNLTIGRQANRQSVDQQTCAT